MLIILMVAGSLWEPLLVRAAQQYPLLRDPLIVFSAVLVVVVPTVIALGFAYLVLRLDAEENAAGNPTGN